MINRLFVLTILICLFSFKKIVSAQAPVNDDCIGAILLNVSPDYQGNYISGTTVDATDSGMNDACNGVGDDDVWYKFGVTNTSQWVFLYPYSNDAVMSFYTGTCMSLDSLTCVNEKIGNSPEIKLLQGLTIGDTIFIRVFEVGSSPTEMGFGISAYAPPINDVCIDAIEIVPIPNEEVSTSITTANAIDENTPTGSCGENLARDIWYKFTPTQSHCKVTLFLPGNINRQSRNTMSCEYVVELRDGSCSGTQIACFKVDCYEGQGSIERNDFVIGDTYYIRLYTSDNSIVNNDVRLILGEPESETEDNCLSAELLYVNEGYCSGSYNNSLGGATETTTPTDSCSVGPYLDLWYKFEVTNVAAIIKASVNSNGNIAIAAFTGSSCGNLTHLQCASDTGDGQNESLYLSGLTLGDTIYIRVYDADIANTAINFNICVYAPPVNDFCANAIQINTTNGANCSGSIAGNTQGATGTGGCNGGSADDDVWFKFVATADIHAIKLDQYSIQSPIIEVYDACGGVSLSCSSNNIIFLTNAIIGHTYFIRVYSALENSGSGTFGICVSTPPINAQCELAIPIVPQAVCTTEPTIYTNVGTPDKVYFNFNAQHIGYTIVVRSENSNFNPILTIDEDCDGVGEVSLVFKRFNVGQNEWRFTYGNYSIGQSYNIGVSSYNQGDFSICVLEPSEHDECINALSINPNIEYNLTTDACTQSNTSYICASDQNDFWVKYTATATQTYFLNIRPSLYDQFIFGEVLSGTDCSSLSSIACISNNGDASFSAVNGSTYYIRVWIKKNEGYSGIIHQTGGINILLSSMAPINNNCSDATILAHGASCTYTAGTTYGASKDNSNTSCSTNANSNDVWYKFTATSSNLRIKVKSLSSHFDPIIKLFQGNNCSSLNLKVCANTFGIGENEVLQYNVNNGTTYYILISESWAAGNFEICISSETNREFISAKYVQSSGDYPKGSNNNYTGQLTAYFVGSGSLVQIKQLKGHIINNDQYITKVSADFDPSPNGSYTFFGNDVLSIDSNFVIDGTANVSGPSNVFSNALILNSDVVCNAGLNKTTGIIIDSIKIGNNSYPVLNIINGLKTISNFTNYSTDADGNWEDTNSWTCDSIPPNSPTSNVNIRNNITVNTMHNIGDLKILDEGTLTLPNNAQLTVGLSSLGNNTNQTTKTFTNLGKLIIIGGTINVNGGIIIGDSLIMSSGIINIDPNNGTNTSYNGHSLAINTNKHNITGGIINILDPPYNSNYNSIHISGFDNYPVVEINALVKLGGGDDTNLSNNNGFRIRSKTPDNNQFPSTFGLMHIDSLVIQGGRYQQRRHFSPDLALYAGSVFIENNCEIYYADNLSLIITKDFINNGYCMIDDALSPYKSIYFTKSIQNSAFISPALGSSVERKFGGSGLFSNSIANGYPATAEGNILRGISLNNTIRLYTPLSISFAFDLHGGILFTSDTSLLTLGVDQPTVSIPSCNYLGYAPKGVKGPIKKWYSGQINSAPQRIFPFYNRTCDINFSNTSLGYVLAEFVESAPLCEGLPLVNEQGTTLRGISPTGYWKMSGNNISGDYSINVNASDFQKMNGYPIYYSDNTIRLIKKSTQNIWALSGATNTNGPSSITSVGATGLNGISDIGIGIADTIVNYTTIRNGSWYVQDTWNQCSTPTFETNRNVEVNHDVDLWQNLTIHSDLFIKNNGILNIDNNAIFNVGDNSLLKTANIEMGGKVNIINGNFNMFGLYYQYPGSNTIIDGTSKLEVKIE